MTNQRVPSVPLITCDPYFSVWSPADRLYEADTCHWTGKAKRLDGVITIDGKAYRFMGTGPEPNMTQVSLRVTATASYYLFRKAGLELELCFFTPLLAEDLDLLSRPCSYIRYSLHAVDGKQHTGRVEFRFDGGLCYHGNRPRSMAGGRHALKGCEAVWMGRQRQTPLCHSGDLISIDWGYFYLAAPEGEVALRGEYNAANNHSGLFAELGFDTAAGPRQGTLVCAYDDIASINYFGDIKKGWWARGGMTILGAIEEAVAQRDELAARCASFDEALAERAAGVAGEGYGTICALAWRQVIAAHKLIADNEGNPVFISKECRSNGCSATADISYPSMPLFLLYRPELVKAMMRPILKFSRMPVWGYDFAPHDVGRYPYLTGQVYGAAGMEAFDGDHRANVYPPYYMYPAGSNAYRLDMQMPVEECGNMLLMAAAVTVVEDDVAFIGEYFDLWETWAQYLKAHGADPSEQLCTDDFAGHLAHNVNLAAKAVMGLEAYSILLRYAGRDEESAAWHETAREMAADWTRRAGDGDHTSLTFGNPDSWSLKYNLVWDILFGSGLFDKALFEKEAAWYLAQRNRYGVPLDNRADYTKSDWILWVAAMTDKREVTEAFVEDLVRYINETPNRVPFCDWYDTITGKEISFQNRTVQGGLFMPMLKAEMLADGKQQKKA